MIARRFGRRFRPVTVPSFSSGRFLSTTPPFGKVLAANRGEIAVRIFRAGSELGIRTVGIYSKEDVSAAHRWKCDEAYLVNAETPVGAYLSVEEVIRICQEHGVDAVHPGYGFLSESAALAEACAAANITFIGPDAETLRRFGDKNSARDAAVAAGVPVIPGSDGPVKTVEEAHAFCAEHGFPVMIKAAHGGGGRGMRVVRHEKELKEAFTRASSEALSSFGDGTVFIERLVPKARHIEVQLLGDGQDVVHLYERDCTTQRRHQKVVEEAPARGLDPDTRQQIFDHSTSLFRSVGYRNAGTAEFLVSGETGEFFFLEVNPRVQVEHGVSEQICGVDIVQSQMHIAAGASLGELGLVQDAIRPSGHAIQVRITTEDPTKQFQPDSGTISVYRSATGPGIRLDDGPGFTGAKITPHYDSLLTKVIAYAPTFDQAVAKLRRATREVRVRGVTTNQGFLLNVLNHPDFLAGIHDTTFIDTHAELFDNLDRAFRNRGEKLLKYLANVAVNGPDPSLGAVGLPPLPGDPPKITIEPHERSGRSLRQIYKEDGAAAFAKAVREHEGTLITDTTWRDAHQSLLATRVRTCDLLAIAPATAAAMAPCYSIENWGGATFDVAMRFLRECPWDRLERMREAIPDIPFQMLLRGANAVGYTAYPDNAVHKFCQVAVEKGMDVFRIFDSLNYLPNLQLGIDAVGSAGGIVEAAICYTGSVTNPRDGRYNLDYYLELARQLVNESVHVLSVKDMAGLLKPQDARLLIGALRSEFPSVPIHVHTHDSAGAGVASMIAAAEAGADAIDAAVDSMAGSTSQPSMGAIVAALESDPMLATGLDRGDLRALEEWWEVMRGVYRPFDTAPPAPTASVYEHEIPGGQLTNLRFQATSLGLGDQWGKIGRAYAVASRLLGDIPKVTPSSKVVGDLAQFLVTNDMSAEEFEARASELSLPTSVVEYLQGQLGVPPYGFPEPLRTKVLKARGLEPIEGRPGAKLPPVNIPLTKATLSQKFGRPLSDTDVLSSIMYPDVYEGFQTFLSEFGNVDVLPTRVFCSPMNIGDEVAFDIQEGKTLHIRLKAIGGLDPTGQRDVVFSLNGESRTVTVVDTTEPEAGSRGSSGATRPKAKKGDANQIGAPMPGAVVDVRVHEGDTVKEGDALVVLSAMKMETIVAAPKSGTLKAIHVFNGDSISAGDLIAEYE